MILQTPMIDYVRATTFDSAAAARLENLFWALASGEPTRAGRVMQYAGVHGGGMFYGQGEQRRKREEERHWLMQSSGERANTVWAWLPEGVNLTRLDIQVTVEKPGDWDSLALYEKLDVSAEHWSGRKKALLLIKGPDGYDTVYIGSRSSEVFVRVYVKPMNEGDALRFELELKGDRARDVHGQLASGRREPGALLLGQVESLPAGAQLALADVASACGTESYRPPAKRRDGTSDTIAWLESQVDAALSRAMADHETGHVARRIVKTWYDMAQELEDGAPGARRA